MHPKSPCPAWLILTMLSSASALAAPAGGLVCPDNYLMVEPADPSFPAFCIAKYEMKNVNGAAASRADLAPWGDLSRTDAAAACGALGYSLPSNLQWQEIAHEIERDGANWSGGAVGNGSLSTGVTGLGAASPIPASNDADACAGTDAVCDQSTWASSRRTHRLPNGIIWDFSGNVSEWVRDDAPATGFSGSAAEPSLRFDSNLLANFATELNFVSNPNFATLQVGFVTLTWDGGAIARGSSFADSTQYAGIYFADGTLSADTTLPYVGFRCVASPSAPVNTNTVTNTVTNTITNTVTNTVTSTITGTATSTVTSTGTSTSTSTATGDADHCKSLFCPARAARAVHILFEARRRVAMAIAVSAKALDVARRTPLPAVVAAAQASNQARLRAEAALALVQKDYLKLLAATREADAAAAFNAEKSDANAVKAAAREAAADAQLALELARRSRGKH